MGAKIRKMIDHASELLELVVNVIIIIAVVVAILSLWKPFLAFVQNRESAHAFLDFLGYVLNVLIGIEFFKMLCKPGCGHDPGSRNVRNRPSYGGAGYQCGGKSVYDHWYGNYICN